MSDRKADIERVQAGLARLKRVCRAKRLGHRDALRPRHHESRPLAGTGVVQGVAEEPCQRTLRQGGSAPEGAKPPPFRLRYVINRATSLDWSILDIFYQLCGFKHFQAMFDLAERDKDEGPVCNLSLVSNYLSRFMDENGAMLSGEFLSDDRFLHLFFSSYVYALFRRGESEYEDAEDPFPRGRIPFITIHQAKGLEFPVVVLGNPRKNTKTPRSWNRSLIRSLTAKANR